MKFSCESAAFSEAVSIAARAVNPKTTIEALEGLLIKAADGTVHVTGYDLSNGIEVAVEARVEESGSIVLPVRTLSEIVRRLPDETIHFESGEKQTATLYSGSAESALMGMDPDEFPALPQVQAEQRLTLSYESLRNLTRRTAFAVAATDARPILMGVFFEAAGENIQAVAVDGFRLGRAREKLKAPIEGEYSFVVPGRSVAEIGRVIKETDEELDLLISKKHLMISKGNITFVCRLLDGEFIGYQSVIPKEKATTAVLATAPLIEAVDRVSTVINERLRSPLILQFGEDTLTILCSSSQGKNRDYLPAFLEGNDCELAVNNRYLMDALKACECEKIRIELLSPLSPIVIKPETGEDFTFIVVPLKYTKAAE